VKAMDDGNDGFRGNVIIAVAVITLAIQ